MNCSNCQHTLMDQAKFCHNCGNEVVQESSTATQAKAVEKGKYLFNYTAHNLVQDKIKDYFLQYLEQKLIEEHAVKNIDEYFRIYVESDFNTTLEHQTAELANTLIDGYASSSYSPIKQDETIELELDKLTENFLFNYCQELHGEELPESILFYENASKGSYDLQKMVLDYLDISKLDDGVYTDFVNMPFNKLQNATTAFLFAAKQEKILLICDQTVFGSCKEGYAISEKGIYWKAHFEQARRIFFRDIKTIKNNKDSLLVNEYFFNAGNGKNLKMLKLLKRMMTLAKP